MAADSLKNPSICSQKSPCSSHEFRNRTSSPGGAPLSKVARFSETPTFRGSLENDFEGALLDTLESIVGLNGFAVGRA